MNDIIKNDELDKFLDEFDINDDLYETKLRYFNKLAAKTKIQKYLADAMYSFDDALLMHDFEYLENSPFKYFNWKIIKEKVLYKSNKDAFLYLIKNNLFIESITYEILNLSDEFIYELLNSNFIFSQYCLDNMLYDIFFNKFNLTFVLLLINLGADIYNEFIFKKVISSNNYFYSYLKFIDLNHEHDFLKHGYKIDILNQLIILNRLDLIKILTTNKILNADLNIIKEEILIHSNIEIKKFIKIIRYSNPTGYYKICKNNDDHFIELEKSAEKCHLCDSELDQYAYIK